MQGRKPNRGKESDRVRPPGRRGRGRGRRRGDDRSRRRRRKAPEPAAPVEPAGPLAPSSIDADKGKDEPLGAEEVREAKRHLSFLADHRRALRLRVNAAEDLLLNGAREPTHRGQVLHLLSKVDLSCVQSALARVSDPRQRVALLAGVVRFSSDVGILLLYLEALSEVTSKAKAAAAFGEAVAQIDFAAVSPARMRRVLQLIESVFTGHERVQVLFGLLASESFRAAFDRAADELPPALAELFVPLRAVYDGVFARRRQQVDPQRLARGVAMILEAPAEVLRTYPEEVRVRLLQSAVRHVHDARLAEAASDVLLGSLPQSSRAFSSLAVLRAAELLRQHRDEDAARWLRQVHSAHPDFRQPQRWLEALAAPRVGRMALVPGAADAPDAKPSRGPRGRKLPGRAAVRDELREAFWLDRQRLVWLRTAPADRAAELEAELELHRDLQVAGVAPLAAAGRADSGEAYAAVPAIGTRGDHWLRRGRPGRDSAMALALAGVQLLHGLARLGVALPELDPRRVLVLAGETPQLLLADFRGARRSEVDAALERHRRLAAAWAARLLRRLRSADRPWELLAALEPAPPLREQIERLAAEV